MRPVAPALPPPVAARVLAAVAPDDGAGPADVVFPRVLGDTADALAEALRGRGWDARVRLTDEADFRRLPPEDAASLWVPPPGPRTPPLLVLFGAQPWAAPFDEDYRVEIAASAHREALRDAGRRVIFVEWPRGARRDREVDLRPEQMADLFGRALAIDYEEMRRWNAELVARLAGADEVRLRCPAGTDVRLSVAGRRWIAEDCRLGADEPVVYLPGGEVYVPAREDSAEGVVAFWSCGEPRLARFEGGLLVALERADGTADEALAEELAVGVEPLCEFGVGTNSWAPPWQLGTLFEKSAGTVHVAVGGNAHFGGERDSSRHGDLVIRDPEVEVDGRPLALPRADWKGWGPGAGRPGREGGA